MPYRHPVLSENSVDLERYLNGRQCEDLKAFGGCRLCVVEAEINGGTRLLVSCVHPVEEGLVLKTRSEKIDRMRKALLELLLAHAPVGPENRKK